MTETHVWEHTHEMIARMSNKGNRDDAAAVYAEGIMFVDGTPSAYSDIDWPSINAYCIGRWSKSGLEYIKRHACQLIKPRAR